MLGEGEIHWGLNKTFDCQRYAAIKNLIETSPYKITALPITSCIRSSTTENIYGFITVDQFLWDNMNVNDCVP